MGGLALWGESIVGILEGGSLVGVLWVIPLLSGSLMGRLWVLVLMSIHYGVYIHTR